MTDSTDVESEAAIGGGLVGGFIIVLMLLLLYKHKCQFCCQRKHNLKPNHAFIIQMDELSDSESEVPCKMLNWL